MAPAGLRHPFAADYFSRSNVVAYGLLDRLSTESVRAVQGAHGSRGLWERFNGNRDFDRFTPNEVAFISARDSFYMASHSESGWPYIQHRGGPAGFVKILDDKTLGFADFRGNRQYITVGNVAADDRVAMILVDYPNQIRLKVLAHMIVSDFNADPALAKRLSLPSYKAKPERAVILRLETFDWNCPQHITPRFTLSEVESAVSSLKSRIETLEADNAFLRRQRALSL